MHSSYLFLSLFFSPLCAAGLIALIARRRPSLAVLASIGSATWGALAILYFLWTWNGDILLTDVNWLTLADWSVSMGFLIDAPAALLLFVVTFVGCLIHIFSVGYMDTDGAKSRFFGGLSIFMFSMLGIVLANNLFMIFIFWELVGFSSYMLIAHYCHTSEAAEASKKAFIVNRIGDFAFLLGIIWAYHHYGTVNLMELRAVVADSPSLIIAPIAFLLMGGFLGKSAQFPLHVWLPDAMAGPTPISALIHAATMVAAGIYFLCRVDFLFPDQVKTLILWLGTGMALYAGLCALAQRDIKKILAYSTLSQLGYMAAAFGLGYSGLALFHLACHAFFKALLFLGSGSVIHACHHQQDIFKMGGLYKRMPITTFVFGIGTAALCAVTFFSGYYSKEAIIEAAYLTDLAVFYGLLAAAYLTALYMGRLYWIAFFGEARSSDSQKAHESGAWMLLPLMVLAVLSLAGGYTALWPNTLSCIFLPELEAVHAGIQSSALWLFVLGAFAWVFGFVFTAVFYGLGAAQDRLQLRLPSVYHFLEKKLWIDEIYMLYIKRIQNRLADILGFIDLFVVGGLLVRLPGLVVGLLGAGFKKGHAGHLQGYIYWFLAAVWAVGYMVWAYIGF